MIQQQLDDLAVSVICLRTKKGWTQYRLSVQSGVPQNAIIDVERGKRDPRLSTLAKLANALGCTLDELTGRN